MTVLLVERVLPDVDMDSVPKVLESIGVEMSMSWGCGSITPQSMLFR